MLLLVLVPVEVVCQYQVTPVGGFTLLRMELPQLFTTVGVVGVEGTKADWLMVITWLSILILADLAVPELELQVTEMLALPVPPVTEKPSHALLLLNDQEQLL